MPFHIAIDGPVAAGKGTVSRLVAEKLGFLYVDTGAMYRTVALLAFKNNVDYKAEDKIVELLKKSRLYMYVPNKDEQDGRISTMILDGEDVSWEIRTDEVSLGASNVSELPKVRKILVNKQQKIAVNKDVVMEGRDITYRVLPNADLKIYLTATDLIRAERRFTQSVSEGKNTTFAKVYSDLIKRDHQNTTRTADPLKKIPEAWEIDTSDLSITEVVEMIVTKAKKIMADKEK